MNRDLISKLYEQAVDHCVELGPNEDGTNRAWVWEEKFAELVVRECASVLAKEMSRLDSIPGREVSAQTMETAQVLIKKHFGVEK